MNLTISGQILKLGSSPLSEEAVTEHIRPLFSKVLAGEAARNEIYLANHSLGRPLDQTAEDVAEGVRLWFEKMDECWDEGGWMYAVDSFRSQVAKLVNLTDPKAVIPKTSAGQGLRAVLNALPLDAPSRPIRVVTTRGEFDSIDFILKTYADKGRAEVKWVEAKDVGGVPMFTVDDLVHSISADTDLVVVSQVFFSTGQILSNLPKLIAAAHEVGALVLVDAYHAVGVVPVDMFVNGADFMIGGSYKYTRGGPGACWLAVHPRHVDGSIRSLDTGWFAKRDPFKYLRPEPAQFAEGGDGWMESTPPVLTAYQARAGLEFTLGVGVERLRKYGLTRLKLLREELTNAGVPVLRPANPDDFGAFALVRSSSAPQSTSQLKAAGVNVDSRGDFVRFGPDLLTTESEIRRAASVAAEILK